MGVDQSWQCDGLHGVFGFGCRGLVVFFHDRSAGMERQ
jgi:hypothetical protein